MASEALKKAMADLAESGEAPELGALPPSRLGRLDHWNEVYEREVKMFNEIGDEGEVWQVASFLSRLTFATRADLRLFLALDRFGEDSAQDMVDWAEEHFPKTDGRILDGASFCSSTNDKDVQLIPSLALFDLLIPPLISLASNPLVGTGNGQLLFCFSSAGYTSLTGIDYSPLSIQLAQSILSARLSAASSHSDEDESSSSPLAHPPPRFFAADILGVGLGKEVEGVTGEQWDLITDKGTYDAVCLSDELKDGRSLRELYVEANPAAGNWTQAELEKAFVSQQTGLKVHSHVPRASFMFGGSTGSSITTIAFEKQ
ncbi:SPOSA6832_02923, partial [Sporobolomyces salmonicolor]